MKVHYSVFYGWKIESKFDEENETYDFEVFVSYDEETKYIVGKYLVKNCYLHEDIPSFCCDQRPPNLEELKESIYKQFPYIKLGPLRLVGDVNEM